VPLACPDRTGNHGQQRCGAGIGHAEDPRSILLVRGRSPAVGVGFEPTVTRATTVFKTAHEPSQQLIHRLPDALEDCGAMITGPR
jgi:hypothetical protein